MRSRRRLHESAVKALANRRTEIEKKKGKSGVLKVPSHSKKVRRKKSRIGPKQPPNDILMPRTARVDRYEKSKRSPGTIHRDQGPKWELFLILPIEDV